MPGRGRADGSIDLGNDLDDYEDGLLGDDCEIDSDGYEEEPLEDVVSTKGVVDRSIDWFTWLRWISSYVRLIDCLELFVHPIAIDCMIRWIFSDDSKRPAGGKADVLVNGKKPDDDGKEEVKKKRAKREAKPGEIIYPLAKLDSTRLWWTNRLECSGEGVFGCEMERKRFRGERDFQVFI